MKLRTIAATATDPSGSTSEFGSFATGLAIPVITLGPLTGAQGTEVTLRAKVTDRLTNGALTGKTVSFYVQNVLIGTSVTNATGVATKKYVITAAGPATLNTRASIASDGTYAANEAKSTITVP